MPLVPHGYLSGRAETDLAWHFCGNAACAPGHTSLKGDPGQMEEAHGFAPARPQEPSKSH